MTPEQQAEAIAALEALPGVTGAALDADGHTVTARSGCGSFELSLIPHGHGEKWLAECGVADVLNGGRSGNTPSEALAKIAGRVRESAEWHERAAHALASALAALTGTPAEPAEVPWRSEPPTVAEIEAHTARLWLERDTKTGTLAIVRFHDPLARHALLDCDPKRGVLMGGGRDWRPVDPDGTPVPWPVIEGGSGE